MKKRLGATKYLPAALAIATRSLDAIGASLEHSNRRTKMINKSKLMLIGTVTALLAGGSSLAMAQYGGQTGYGGPNGSQLLVTAPAGGPAYAPAAPGPGYRAHHHTINHQRKS
jgi:hypothetical protein